MSIGRFKRSIGVGAYEKEIKKIENKLRKVRDLDSRNVLIIKLNTFLRLAGKKIQYKKETQEDRNIQEYNDRRQKA